MLMNLTLKSIYFCATNRNNWGKGYTIASAKKNAKVLGKSDRYHVFAAIFNNPNEDQLKNLFTCIASNPIDGSPQYYSDDRTKEDDDMIKEFHIGWLIVDKNY